MNTLRPCGCKGCRTCLLCEKDFGIGRKDFFAEYQNLDSYVFCPECNLLFKGWDIQKVMSEHANHSKADGIEFPGILVQTDFITAEEGVEIMTNLDSIPWQGSQSGRRKQNFGPKTNFKRKKLQNGEFDGFPDFSKFIQERFEEVELLKGFQTIEQCTLEYDPTKGASIDPHIDDCWVWGERVVTVNCLGDSVLTLVTYSAEDPQKYNLDLVAGYKEKLISKLWPEEELKKMEKMVIRIPMPNLSLIVMYGAPRYQFVHSVLREDVTERRVCLAYREFTPMYLKGGVDEAKGNVVTENAQNFWSPCKKYPEEISS